MMISDMVVRSENGVVLRRDELISHGCRNCIWKLHMMCPHGLSGNEFRDEGYCDELVGFLFSLVKEGDSENVLWENFNLYILRLQSLEDYRSFKQLQDDITRLQNEGKSDLGDLEAKKNSYKLWWYKLNENVLKGLGRVVDREKRVSGDSRPSMTIQQLNLIISQNSEKLLESEKR